jgi:aminoglycoside phosphotransferase (APT) family kinase protein
VPVWTPDLVVTAAIARRLLGQFPELEVESVEEVATGWDNVVYLVNERWSFRFPQREIAIPGVRRELAVLPRLEPLLPLPVPTPAFVGRPDGHYPWPFFGAAYLPGVEVAEAGLEGDDRVAALLELAPFLRELHTLELDAELPVDPNRRTTPARPRLAREQLAEVQAAGLWQPPPRAEELLAAAEVLPPAQETVLVHGDLHARHVLVACGRVTGVIDWGDVCLADRSVDLSLLWSFLPPDARPAFIEAYGPLDEAQLLRARVLALSLCSALALFARAEGHPALERECVEGLARIVLD